MMPPCNYGRCRKPSEIKVLEMVDPYDKDWHISLYMCKRHAKKIIKKLHIKQKGDEKSDLDT